MCGFLKDVADGVESVSGAIKFGALPVVVLSASVIGWNEGSVPLIDDIEEEVVCGVGVFVVWGVDVADVERVWWNGVDHDVSVLGGDVCFARRKCGGEDE